MAKRARRVNDDRTEATSITPMDLGHALGFLRLLWAVDHSLTRISKRMLRTAGVTGPQRLVVRLVGQAPGVSAGTLAETLHLHPSTLTGILRRLQQRGVIERTADPNDTRRAQLRLTRKGEKVDSLRAGTVEARVRGALVGITGGDLMAAERVLTRLADSLSNDP